MEDGLKVSGDEGDVDADSLVFEVLKTVASLRCRYCLDRVDNLVSIVECWRSSLFPINYPQDKHQLQYLSLFLFRQISQTENNSPFFGL